MRKSLTRVTLICQSNTNHTRMLLDWFQHNINIKWVNTFNKLPEGFQRRNTDVYTYYGRNICIFIIYLTVENNTK